MILLSQSGKKYDWLNDKTIRDEDSKTSVTGNDSQTKNVKTD